MRGTEAEPPPAFLFADASLPQRPFLAAEFSKQALSDFSFSSGSGAMKKILIQLDTDPRPSSFDRVVAVDAGVDELFSYGGITPETVEPLVHGAIFTRGPKDLKSTAIFIGGSQVPAGEELLRRVSAVFFGPM